MKYPIQSYSWEVLTPSVAIKHMDKSAFLHHGTGVPREIAFFFNLDFATLVATQPVVLVLNGKHYSAHLQADAQHSRYRLFWKSDFSQAVRNEFPDFHRAFSRGAALSGEPPLMRIERRSEGRYSVDLILSETIRADVDGDIQEEYGPRPEGRATVYYGKKYERDPVNRREAIAYHGLGCAACGFHFEDAYGALGAGFIEIHHNKPLSVTGEERVIDPKTDLTPLCANCHRMVHRPGRDAITVEKLRRLVRRDKAL